MIKIGNCYFNESQIAAIGVSPFGNCADVHLVGGGVVSAAVREEDLPGLLEKAGLLSPGPAESGVEILTLAAEERRELQMVFAAGYEFAAKDKNGHVFAHKEKPVKLGSEWVSDDSAGIKRIHGEFECLSFEDDRPLSLEDLFGPDAGED